MNVSGAGRGIILLALMSHSSISSGHPVPEMQHPLEIHVRDREGALIKDVVVSIRPEGSSQAIVASYDDSGIYYSDMVQVRWLVIEVRHPEYESQERRIRIESAHTRATFILGRPGDTYAYVSNIMMPYVPMHDILGFLVTGALAEEAGSDKELRSRLASAFAIDPDSIRLLNNGSWPRSSAYGIIRINTKGGTDVREYRSRLLELLRTSDLIKSAGPVLKMEEHSNGAGTLLQLFTNRIDVRFHPSVKDEDARKILEGMGLRVIDFRGAIQAYETIAPVSVGEEINQFARQLRGMENVYWADVITSDMIPKGW